MRSFMLFASLSLLSFQTGGLQAKPNEAATLCPSDDILGGVIDKAHLVFTLPADWDYKTFVMKAQARLQESENPKVQHVEFKEKNFGFENLPAFSYRTGEFRTLPCRQEELVEFVVVRPYDDCAGKDVLHPADENLFVVSRAFSDDDLNLALVSTFLRNGIHMQPLSERGHDWICSNVPGHESCVAPEL